MQSALYLATVLQEYSTQITQGTGSSFLLLTRWAGIAALHVGQAAEARNGLNHVWHQPGGPD